MMIIDTHAHIYSPDEKRYPPIDEPLRPRAGKGSLEHLRRESLQNGVLAVCAIQTTTFYRFDNRYICDSAKSNPDWVGGVCTLDPDDPHSPGLLAQLVREYGLRGMRSIPTREGKLDHPGVRALWKMALDLGIVINLLINRDKAAEADLLLDAFPRLRVVLDHCLNLKAGSELDSTLAEVLFVTPPPPTCQDDFSPNWQWRQISLLRYARSLPEDCKCIRARTLRLGK